MKIFVTGTDTNVGKTVICSWLCYHLNYAYWKPVQTGSREETDTKSLQKLANQIICYTEQYIFEEPVSPHFAAKLNKADIDLNKIDMPEVRNLIIEGAGGVLVPLNQNKLMIDLIQQLNTPVIIVARSSLGTINHTLLAIEALRHRKIPILGVILNHYIESDLILENKRAIETYGQVSVLAEFPAYATLTPEYIQQKILPDKLRKALNND